jgi:hypothetical protein
MAVGFPVDHPDMRKLSRLFRLHETELQRGFCYWSTAEDPGTLGKVLEGDFRIKYRRIRGNSRVQTAVEIFSSCFSPILCFVSGSAEAHPQSRVQPLRSDPPGDSMPGRFRLFPRSREVRNSLIEKNLTRRKRRHIGAKREDEACRKESETARCDK